MVNLIGRTNCPFFTIPADPLFEVVFVNDIVSNLEVVAAFGSQTLFEKGEDETANYSVVRDFQELARLLSHYGRFNLVLDDSRRIDCTTTLIVTLTPLA
jgi:hypothetical protein